MNVDRSECERVGEHFELQTYLKARDLCIQIVDRIIAHVEVGMSAEDGHHLIKDTFNQFGVTKFWHPSKFRIGADTIKSFREVDNSGLQIKEGDICFVDVGPIYEGHEADFGRSFIIGSNPENERLVNASHEVFQKTFEYWKKFGKTGKELFNFADQQAQRWGYKINPTMAGHRLGDFPHKVFSSQNLFSFEKRPFENLWVLEIHLIDDRKQTGAFFEDVLLG